jgi:NAD(P)-dependent dehydrogenase (short-subunit alcohol dehydrogenase family)
VKLTNKVVVITGSGGGIGEGCARRFTAEGAKVVVTDIDAAGVARVAHAIGSVGLAVDITVEDERFLIVDSDITMGALVAKTRDYDAWIDEIASGWF